MLLKGIILVTFILGTTAIPTPDFDKRPDVQENGARIVGGSEAAEGSVPWMVGITTGFWLKSLMCGGSLVTERHVLTAGHCIDDIYGGGVLLKSAGIVVGTNRWNSGGTQYKLSHNASHPHYMKRALKNDIAFLITKEKVVLSKLVQLVTLNYDYVEQGVDTRIAGWGLTKRNGFGSKVLLELNTKTIDSAECITEVERAGVEFKMSAPDVEPHIEVCTYHSVGKGNCNGDSGSALIRTDNSNQIGVVSWGFPCARGAPDVYARVSAFKDFIEGVLATPV